MTVAHKRSLTWIKRLSATTFAAFLGIQLVTPAHSIENTTQIPESELHNLGLTDEEIQEFNQYLIDESLFQETVETSPIVVSDNEDAAQDPGFGLFTTNPVKHTDERIGALYFSDLPGISNLTCTANYIGGKFWTTAHHCVEGRSRFVGFIEQSDGQYAGIEHVYTKSSDYDIALIKVGSGIDAEQFSLTRSRPAVGKMLEVVGFAVVNPFSSRATMEVTNSNTVANYPMSNLYYKDVFSAKPAGSFPYVISGGDSGAAVWSGETMYGIASGSNGSTKNLAANVGPHVSWIEQTMQNNSNSSPYEILQAFRGGLATSYPKYNQIRDLVDSSS